MKLKTVWTLLLFCLMIVGVRAAEKPLRPATAAEMKTFDALFQETHRAALQRDLKSLGSRLAPNFTAYSAETKTTLNRAQYLRLTATLLQKIVKFDTLMHKIQKLGFRDQKAYATAINAQAFHLRDSKGKLHLFKIVSRTNSVWVATPRGWLVQSIAQTDLRSSVDGREIRRNAKTPTRIS